jgi:hypothetical protein
MFPPMSGVTSIQPPQRSIGGHLEAGGGIGNGRDHVVEHHDDVRTNAVSVVDAVFGTEKHLCDFDLLLSDDRRSLLFT